MNAESQIFICSNLFYEGHSMSYDILVFDSGAAPSDRRSFLDWFSRLAEWSELHDHADPANSGRQLQGWYRSMIAHFPAMNGPDGVSDEDLMTNPEFVADYCFTRNAIYSAFNWRVVKEAYDHSLMYAALHEIGFFDVSANDGAVWLPGPNGYRIAHGGGPTDRETERALAEWLAIQPRD